MRTRFTSRDGASPRLALFASFTLALLGHAGVARAQGEPSGAGLRAPRRAELTGDSPSRRPGFAFALSGGALLEVFSQTPYFFVPLRADVGVRLDDRLTLTAFGRFSPGPLASSLLSTIAVGVAATLREHGTQLFDPWASFGVAFRQILVGAQGVELANVRFGGDLRLAEGWLVGPYVEGSVSYFFAGTAAYGGGLGLRFAGEP